MSASNNIVNVSKQQRVVFVDNISNEKSKELSSTYKFGLFLGNGPTGLNVNEVYEHNTGLIYKDGKRYSLVTAISNQPIRINTGERVYNIRLQINESGVLSLSTTNAVQDFILDGYTSNGQYRAYTEDSGEILHLYEDDCLYFHYIDAESGEVIYYTYDNLLTFEQNDYISSVNLSSASERKNNSDSSEYRISIAQNTSENQTLTISCEIANGNSTGTLTKSYPFQTHKLSSDIFYIGCTTDYVDRGQYFKYDSDLSIDLSSAGWHSLDPAFYGENWRQIDVNAYYAMPHENSEEIGFEIDNISEFVVILPAHYSIYIHNMYNDNVIGNNVSDYFDQSILLKDGSFDIAGNITINSQPYVIYKYLDGVVNDIIAVQQQDPNYKARFINLIK